MKVPPQYKNILVYKKAKKMIDKQYGLRTSAWKSMALVKKYKELGGVYESKSKVGKLHQWRKERWIQVIPYIVSKSIVTCGATRRARHACRPLNRVSKRTPITLPELLRIHSQKRLIYLANMKNKQKVRINWKKGTYIVLQ
tara:strand:+ start:201 stop:623 length:423 start_codon:yes stop_codon:yes gene_type:complete